MDHESLEDKTVPINLDGGRIRNEIKTLIHDAIKQNLQVVGLMSRVGTGKSTQFLRCMMREKAILAVDSVATVKQLESSVKGAIQYCYEGQPYQPKGYQTICTTYDQLIYSHYRGELGELSDWVLMLDECQAGYSADYRSVVMAPLVELIRDREFKLTLLASGTANFRWLDLVLSLDAHFTFNDGGEKPPITLVNIDDMPFTSVTLGAIRKFISSQSTGKLLVFSEDKAINNTIATRLNDDGVDAVAIDSGTDKDSDVMLSIKEHGTLSNQVTLATSVLATGVSINDPELEMVVIVGNMTLEQTKQAIGRDRTKESDVMVLRKKRDGVRVPKPIEQAAEGLEQDVLGARSATEVLKGLRANKERVQFIRFMLSAHPTWRFDRYKQEFKASFGNLYAVFSQEVRKELTIGAAQEQLSLEYDVKPASLPGFKADKELEGAVSDERKRLRGEKVARKNMDEIMDESIERLRIRKAFKIGDSFDAKQRTEQLKAAGLYELAEARDRDQMSAIKAVYNLQRITARGKHRYEVISKV